MSLRLSIKFAPGSAMLESAMEIPLAAIGADTSNTGFNKDIVSLFASSTLAETVKHCRAHSLASINAPVTRDIFDANGQHVKLTVPSMHLSDGILSNPGPMQVFIRTLTGKTLTFAILPDSTVHELMLMVQDSEGIPPDVQRLIFKGIQMEKMRDLAGYGILANSTIYLVTTLRGS